MEIFAYPIILITFAIWQIFPTGGFWIYAVFFVLYLLFTIPPLFTAKQYFEPIKDKLLTRLSYEEYDFLKRHALYYMYPSGARSFSSVDSFLQLLGIIFGVVFLIRKFWLYGIICIINYPLFAFIAPLLNKPFYLADAMRSGTSNPHILKESQLAQKVGDFMQNDWRDFVEEIKREKEKKDASYED